MNAELIVGDVIRSLERKFGRKRQLGRGRITAFGSAMICSINYSKLLHGHKYFYAVPRDIIDANHKFPDTTHGEFVALICGSADKVLMLPRGLMLKMMAGVTTRRIDVFLEAGSYVLQTTKHPKYNVTEYLNAFPERREESLEWEAEQSEPKPESRTHVKAQWALITLGRAAGCSVWVPISDRNLSYEKQPFTKFTASRLPNFGFDEYTRSTIQNIDVLWLARNVILKAFEIEATTAVYSGLLRLNDLVLSQPNIQIDLFVAAPKARRPRVESQLMRPSFQPLLPKCQFVTFEHIDEQMGKLAEFPLDKGARVSGLIQGERFQLPDHYAYPSDPL